MHNDSFLELQETMRALSYQAFDEACTLDHVKDGAQGDWTIKTVTAPQPSAIDKVRASLRSMGRLVPGGTYRILYRGSEVIMSNTPDEKSDHYTAWSQATGHVLVTGLGLGMMVSALLRHPKVHEVTVIEKSEDVIHLVGPAVVKLAFLCNKRLHVHHADAFTWQPDKGQTFDCAWHDIWDNICSDNLPEMRQLQRRFARKVKRQAFWCRQRCQAAARRGW